MRREVDSLLIKSIHLTKSTGAGASGKVTIFGGEGGHCISTKREGFGENNQQRGKRDLGDGLLMMKERPTAGLNLNRNQQERR
jgi:hypothetical protein